jgi:hypothetical protein
MAETLDSGDRVVKNLRRLWVGFEDDDHSFGQVCLLLVAGAVRPIRESYCSSCIRGLPLRPSPHTASEGTMADS